MKKLLLFIILNQSLYSDVKIDGFINGYDIFRYSLKTEEIPRYKLWKVNDGIDKLPKSFSDIFEKCKDDFPPLKLDNEHWKIVSISLKGITENIWLWKVKWDFRRPLQTGSPVIYISYYDLHGKRLKPKIEKNGLLKRFK